MTDLNAKISSYEKSLFHAATKPRFRELVVSSYNFETASKADTEAKLVTLSALLMTGRFDDVSLLIQKLDFNDIPPDARRYLAHSVFTMFSGIILSDREGSFAAKMLQLLAAISPETILAHKMAAEPVKPEHLLELDYEPDIKSSVKGAIFARGHIFGPESKKHEISHRLQSALASQGWSISEHPIDNISDYVAGYGDFALIDSLFLSQQENFDKLYETLLRLKSYFGKIIVFELDPWWADVNSAKLMILSDLVDCIWGFTSDWELTKKDVFKNKSILFPGIGGFDHLDSIKQADLDWNTCTFNFTGSVQRFNINRAYWVLETIAKRLPVKIKLSDQKIDDGLDSIDSANLYAQTLADTHASLNFTTRSDGSQRHTGRSTEILSLNRLLLQERCPVFHYFYVEGEHFLEFSDIEELCTIIDFLRSHPKVAQGICKEGHQFYLERYSCRKLVEHIQTWL